MTRHRINIDLDSHHHEWLELTARVVGATKTEVARAILVYMRHHNAMPHHELQGMIKTQRLDANQKRGERQKAHRQAQRESSHSPAVE